MFNYFAKIKHFIKSILRTKFYFFALKKMEGWLEILAYICVDFLSYL